MTPDTFDYSGFETWQLETLAEEFARKKSLTPDEVQSLILAKEHIEKALEAARHD